MESDSEILDRRAVGPEFKPQNLHEKLTLVASLIPGLGRWGQEGPWEQALATWLAPGSKTEIR